MVARQRFRASATLEKPAARVGAKASKTLDIIDNIYRCSEILCFCLCYGVQVYPKFDLILNKYLLKNKLVFIYGTKTLNMGGV